MAPRMDMPLSMPRFAYSGPAKCTNPTANMDRVKSAAASRLAMYLG